MVQFIFERERFGVLRIFGEPEVGVRRQFANGAIELFQLANKFEKFMLDDGGMQIGARAFKLRDARFNRLQRAFERFAARRG